jgi:pantothenate kinase
MPKLLTSLDQALARAKELASGEKRVLIGVIGKPGAGKSTLTSYLINNLEPGLTALVPMDGYHLSNKQLQRLNLSDSKGAFNTFDSDGFVSLLRRINLDTDKDIYYPIFHREIEESIVAEGVVLKDTKLVLTEGNYLLLDKYGWQDVSSFLTESWYIEINDNLRWERLMARSIRYGRSPESAHAWTHGSDEVNAKVVESTKNRADVILNLS